ncbi:MAG TPA: hypothetical protein VJB08_04980 [Candidatus Nanoarchaeia archaeon]|nr:hypothetical protein [Candidatus Nanoarchaeia archaeon]
MDITPYGVEIKRHAFIRAMERDVTPDMIEATLKGGKVERFGKHNVRFIKDCKRFTVICVGQMIGARIKIFTIETKGDKK